MFNSELYRRIEEEIYTSLSKTFPEFNWIVLPELDANKGEIGFYIAANVSLGGYPASVVSRPRVLITQAEEMGTPKFLRTILGAFYTTFKNQNLIETPFSSYVLGDSQECPTILLK